MIFNKNTEKWYDRFYAGENRREIFHAFCGLVQAMRTDDMQKLDDLCDLDCEAHISTTGHSFGLDGVKAALEWPGPKCDVSRASIWNFTARTCNGEAVQYAYLQCTRSIIKENDVYPFHYGFRFSNKLKKKDGRWYFVSIRADLCYTSGNDLFVYGKWNLIDHFKFTGHETMINAEMDNPWNHPDEEAQSDAEKIFELTYRFTYAFDMNDYHFMNSFTTDDFILNEGKKNLRPGDSPNPGDRMNKREIYDFLRYKWYKEAQMMHAYRPVSIAYFDKDNAEAILYRGEDHRIKDKILNTSSVHEMVTNMICTCGARRENGDWKMTKYRLEMTNGAFRTEDDCVVFDEYARDMYGNDL